MTSPKAPICPILMNQERQYSGLKAL